MSNLVQEQSTPAKHVQHPLAHVQLFAGLGLLVGGQAVHRGLVAGAEAQLGESLAHHGFAGVGRGEFSLGPANAMAQLQVVAD